jgi:hypothetical protein
VSGAIALAGRFRSLALGGARMVPPTGRDTADAADEVLAELMQRIDAGQRIDRDALRAAFPEIADDLCAYLDTADRVERMAGPTAGSLEGRAQLETVVLTPFELADPSITPRSISGDLSVPDAGTTFGDYELLEEIARGGMGVVFKARQISLGRIVAVKMILTGRLATRDDVQRFRQEAEAAANLSHEHIVDIYEVGEVDGHHYFSMEYVPGSDLGRLVRHHPLPAEQAAQYLHDVAAAIQFAHDRGILHRDLKPSNVLIDAAGRPQITDFGLAKRVRNDSGLTDTGQIVGTPSYMPPEQAWPGQGDIGPASDVYSLGAILYELLTGRPPFRAATVMDTLVQVLDTEPASPRLLNNKVPRDLETICLKCLIKDPAKRYQTAREMQEELDRFLTGQPIKARPINAAARLVRWSKRNPVAAGLIASSLLLLIVVSALAFSAARTFERQLHDNLRRNLAFVAEHIAHTVSDRLNELASRAVTNAQKPELIAAVRERDTLALAQFMTPRNGFPDEGLSTETTWIVLDPAGRGLMRSPLPEGFVGAEWGFRDYVNACVKDGRWTQAGSYYISRPYHSRLGGLYKFAIMTPVYDPLDATARSERRIIGLLGQTFASDADLGVPELHDDVRQTVLVALDDPDQLQGEALAPSHRIIVHPAYRQRRGKRAEIMSAGPFLDYLRGRRDESADAPDAGPLTDDEYVDAVSSESGMAAMTPVPRSPFWIVVQERGDEAIGLASIAGEFSITAAVALGLTVFIMSNAIGHAIRRGTWRRA